MLDNIRIYIEDNKVKIITISLILLITAISSIGIYHYNNLKADANTIENVFLADSSIEIEDNNIEKNADIIINKIKVDIKGEVNRPGVYEVDETSRVIDIINIAGGLTKNADTSVNNLSKRVFDEAVIIIYSKEQVNNFAKVKEDEHYKLEEIKKDDNVVNNDSKLEEDNIVNNNNNNTSSPTDKTEGNTKISINTASVEELVKIPSIGEAKAKKIIEYRTQNGNFEKIEDIINVSGIGESVFAKIKEYLTT